ncbi:putative pentatricopeptide [Medicago truncatula]|uniref:Putative pentatricopeptide n=1 Tax=Medicago truncatula TaxID=3880 RepID=A0A396GSE7_MEDTR|nr:putative pentatricopeptide [Medicago truncatula]
MYAKCGEIGNAELVFEEVPEKDTGLWNTSINGYGVNGYENEALEVFAVMFYLLATIAVW